MEVLKDFAVTFLNAFLQLILPTLAAVLAGFVIKWVKTKIASAEANLDAGTKWMIESAVRSAVLAAEQVGLAGELDDKKEYAIEAAQEALDGWGISISLSELDVLIEAAVMQEFNKGKPTTTTE
jgi:hypothetical protein